VHVKHLRDKLGPAGKMIANVRGVGYKIVAPESAHRPAKRK
jgi:DNA-binding response OmpR family regulator